MPRPPVIVLKFGGSVLRDAASMRAIASEIQRWRTDGWRVLAVVSALTGRTDELTRLCAGASGPVADHVRASVLALGETESAALLGLTLDREGIPCAVLHPSSVRMSAVGPALDASPRAIDTAPIVRALDESGTCVFPGFFALNESGRTVTLGRGGSDLTAVFLAGQLAADRCRLVKDVDGLYASDPNAPGPPPRRYDHASYDEAAATDGSILQHKAIDHARAHALEFELGALLGDRATRIGHGPPAPPGCAAEAHFAGSRGDGCV